MIQLVELMASGWLGHTAAGSRDTLAVAAIIRIVGISDSGEVKPVGRNVRRCLKRPSCRHWFRRAGAPPAVLARAVSLVHSGGLC